MEKDIEALLLEATSYEKDHPGQTEEFKHRFIGRKGRLAQLFKKLKEIPDSERQAIGQRLNEAKKQLEAQWASMGSLKDIKQGEPEADLTLPPVPHALGGQHILHILQEKMVKSLTDMGFEEAEGPEIEDEFHNFSALNFPLHHPARDMQDTFFLNANKEHLLRTHTSNVQVRVMNERKPPMRVVSTGKVYRNEAISARTHCVFHQMEGFYIDENVSIAELEGVLLYFIRRIFGKERKMRLRPSYFPFTEPSVEVDISCTLCNQAGCSVCKQSGWVEILGAGMIDPNVLKACQIDPEKYSGFAFGAGIERIAMLCYQIQDIRLFTQNDVRFLQQFAPFH